MERRPRPKRQPRPEIDVENEPELVPALPGIESLYLPAAWTPEHRAAFVALWFAV